MVIENSKTFLVFSYGSNMLTSRIRHRCHSATALGVAELENYALRWHKQSRDESGKCNIIASHQERSTVYGVLYRILASEKNNLDRAEGLGNGYEEKTVTVICNHKAYKASLYYATAIDDSLRPYTWYKALVVAGAKEHGLPEAYIANLEAAEAIEDPDCQRHTKEMAYINNATGAM